MNDRSTERRRSSDGAQRRSVPPHFGRVYGKQERKGNMRNAPVISWRPSFFREHLDEGAREEGG